jgi:hypothetical protein
MAADQQLEHRGVAAADEAFQKFGVAQRGASVGAGDVAKVADDVLGLTARHGIPLAAVNVLLSPLTGG